MELGVGESDNTNSTVTTQAAFRVVQNGMAVASAVVSSASAGISWAGNTPAWTLGIDIGRCSVGHSGANTTSAYASSTTDTVTATVGFNEYQVIAVASLAPSGYCEGVFSADLLADDRKEIGIAYDMEPPLIRSRSLAPPPTPTTPSRSRWIPETAISVVPQPESCSTTPAATMACACKRIM